MHAGQRIPVCTIHSAKNEVVATADLTDRTGEHRRAGGTLADLARHLPSEAIARLAAHHLQRLADFLIRHDIQKRRLCQTDRERLLERVVETGVAGGVGKVCDDDLIFVGELGSSMRAPVETTPDRAGDHNCRDACHNLVPPSLFHWCRLGRQRRRGS